MSQETMTIHRAMVERKTIDARIAKAIQNAAFCTAAKVNSKKLFGQPVEQFAESAKSDYDSISTLIARRNAINAAIPVSNAITKVTVGDKEMTVAEAISFKQNAIPILQKFLFEMNQQYTDSVAEVEKNNATLDKRADAHISAIYGGDKGVKAADPDEINKTRQTYIDANTFELIDGLKDSKGKNDIESRIKALQDEIETFRNELDAALSVSNATTTIDIHY